MALDQTRRNALVGSRQICANKLSPLADRLLWDMYNYRDEKGGSVLTASEVDNLKAIPSNVTKIRELWKKMTLKGMRGWEVLLRVLDGISPEVKLILLDKLEEVRGNDGGYYSQANTPSDNGPNVFYSRESAGISDDDEPLPRLVALEMQHNKSEAYLAEHRGEMAGIIDTPVDNLLCNGQDELVEPMESAGIYDQVTEVARNMPLAEIGDEGRHILAAALNPNKEFVVRIGRELGAPPNILSTFRRVGNPTGLLLSNVGPQATLDNLCDVLEKYGRKDLSDQLLTVQ